MSWCRRRALGYSRTGCIWTATGSGAGRTLPTVSEELLPRDHWVSRGYQQNFAELPDKRVAVFDVHERRIVDPGRPIKSNFRERGFTTFLEAGVPNSLLERAFASVESSVLNEIRTVSFSCRGAPQKAAVANLFAIHLVRSPSFKRFYAHVTDSYRRNGVAAVAEEPALAARFVSSKGRPPAEGELLRTPVDAFDDLVADPLHLVTTMVRRHDAMAEKLNSLHLQVIEITDDWLPGFVLADTPVVHAREERYGFRDRLALGDATLIVGPLTRRTAACFTSRPEPPARFTTAKKIAALNAVFLRAADAEVACHPGDAIAIGRTFSRLDSLPTTLLTGPQGPSRR